MARIGEEWRGLSIVDFLLFVVLQTQQRFMSCFIQSLYADIEVSNQPLLNSQCRWQSFTLQAGSLSVQHTYYKVSTTNI